MDESDISKRHKITERDIGSMLALNWTKDSGKRKISLHPCKGSKKEYQQGER
jgi:hypothetical protein